MQQDGCNCNCKKSGQTSVEMSFSKSLSSVKWQQANNAIHLVRLIFSFAFTVTIALDNTVLSTSSHDLSILLFVVNSLSVWHVLTTWNTSVCGAPWTNDCKNDVWPNYQINTVPFITEYRQRYTEACKSYRRGGLSLRHSSKATQLLAKQWQACWNTAQIWPVRELNSRSLVDEQSS